MPIKKRPAPSRLRPQASTGQPRSTTTAHPVRNLPPCRQLWRLPALRQASFYDRIFNPIVTLWYFIFQRLVRLDPNWVRMLFLISKSRLPHRRHARPSEPRAQRHLRQPFPPLLGSRDQARRNLRKFQLKNQWHWAMTPAFPGSVPQFRGSKRKFVRGNLSPLEG